jgi:hypothetical protein
VKEEKRKEKSYILERERERKKEKERWWAQEHQIGAKKLLG